MTRTVAQRFFDPRPGDAIDDAGDVAETLLNASDQEILGAAGVRPLRANEPPRDAAKRALASTARRNRKK